MTKSLGLLMGAAAVAAVLAWQSDARANCAMPVGYDATVDGNSVTVCPSNHANRACPDAGGMLRQNPASTEVVRLADFCSGTGYSGDCYLDECVPAGTYRYGFATPYDCCSSCCGTDYYQEVIVETELPTDCARTDGNAAPEAYTGALPWQDSPTICNYQGSSGSGGSSGTGGEAGSAGTGGVAGSAGTGGVAGSAGTGGAAGNPPASEPGANDDDGGCSISARPQRTVLALNVLALVVGLGVLARRRRPHR